MLFKPQCGRTRCHGFTLIETVVALLIVSLVLAGAIRMVSQQNDQRFRMMQTRAANAIAWSEIMQIYQLSKAWDSSIGGRTFERNGRSSAFGFEYEWEVDSEQTAAGILTLYRVSVKDAEGSQVASRSAYFSADPSR